MAGILTPILHVRCGRPPLPNIFFHFSSLSSSQIRCMDCICRESISYSRSLYSILNHLQDFVPNVL